jgi:hypothetical protein
MDRQGAEGTCRGSRTTTAGAVHATGVRAVANRNMPLGAMHREANQHPRSASDGACVAEAQGRWAHWYHACLPPFFSLSPASVRLFVCLCCVFLLLRVCRSKRLRLPRQTGTPRHTTAHRRHTGNGTAWHPVRVLSVLTCCSPVCVPLCACVCLPAVCFCSLFCCLCVPRGRLFR